MKKAIYIFLLVIVSLFTLFIGNRVKPVDVNESENLATAREMVVYGNYLNPTLNGEPRLDKPPLSTWGAAAVESLFPGSIAWQRSLTGVMGMLWVIFTFLIAIELGSKQRHAFWIGLIMATCYSVMFMSRNATCDIWCHAMMSIAIFCYVKGIKSPLSVIPMFVTAGCFMGLSFLSKGFTSFYTLLLPFLISFHLVYKPYMNGKWFGIGTMIVVALVIGGWWYMYLNITNNGTLLSVIHKETTAWEDQSTKPWYYYFYLFFTESGVWCLYWLASLIYTFVYGWYKKEKLLVMSAIWTVIALVLLSIPPEKKTRYLLPMMMPCAISVGSWFYVIYLQLKSNFTRIEGIYVFKTISSIVSLTMISIGVALFFKPVGIDLSFGIIILSLLSITAGILGIYVIYIKPNGRSLRFSCIKIRMLLFIFTVELCCIPLLGMKSIGKAMTNQHISSISEFREMKELDSCKIYYPIIEELRPEIMYAAGKRIIPLDFDNTEINNIGKPFLLILSKPLEEYSQLNDFKVIKVKRYDANCGKKDSNSYNHNLVKDIYHIE